MDYSDQRLQFLDLTDATENDQSFIEQILFSTSQVLEVPWCTETLRPVDEQPENEWSNSAYSDEERSELQSNQVLEPLQDTGNENDQHTREQGPDDVSQAEPQEQSSHQEQLPRQGGIFPPHPPTSLPHQAQPMFQMYQMVPSLSNVYVSNVTANVNVHPPYVPPMPAHYSQMPPHQQPPSQQMYPHASSEAEQGNRNRRQRQKNDKKREGPFVQTNEVIPPSLENHPPPQFPNIHPMQPYYISGAPGAPVYMQHAVLPVYPSAMFSPYGPSPGPLVYPQANNMEPGNEYNENVQQNFHQTGPEMVVVNCPMRQGGASERRGIETNENHYQLGDSGQLVQEPTGIKQVPEGVQLNVENTNGQSDHHQISQHNGERFIKVCLKEESVKGGILGFDSDENTPAIDVSINQNPGLSEETFSNSNSNSQKNDSSFHLEVGGKLPKKANVELDVNNMGKVTVNMNSSAGEWSEETRVQGAVAPVEVSAVKINNSDSVKVLTVTKVQEGPMTASQDNDFPLIGQNVRSSSRQPPSLVSPESEVTGTGPASQATPSSGGKSWASLFNRSDRFSAAPMSDNRGRPLARVHPYHEAESSTPGGSLSTPSPKDPNSGAKQEKTISVKVNGSLSKDSVSEPSYINDPNLHNLGVFLCNYELEHKIVSLQPRGLTNRSNWCYVNAILQSLIACPPFYNLLKALPINKKGNKQTLIMDALVEYANEFSLLPANARIGKREKSARNKEESTVVEIMAGPAFEPSGIYKILDKVRGESSFNVEGRQEDAEEFLSCLLNGLNDEMFELMKTVDPNKLYLSNGDANGALENSAEDDDSEWNVMGPKNRSSVTRRAVCGRTPISDIFRGQFRSRVQRAGDQSTDTVQPFFTLQLDIEKASSVKDALELFMGRDPLEGVTCSRTHQEVEAWTQTVLEDLPLVLILHLKCYDYKSDACSKIIKSVEFQVDLKIDSKLLSNRNKYTGKQRNYKLVAVVYHDGKEASKGHYVTDAYHVGYGCWLRYDDVVVRSVPESHVLKPRAPRVPYLLYYRRTDTIGPTK